ncbi:uncharacterized protein LOC126976582 isoform X2 [Leptidea sinapis]|uniref:uncharacterized protein LOC126976582 isoform X2 n=1 Tax=Leptidea sinapis TaxID=189913 RepID=UPI002123ED79|nr:uncharacterized protein LOC126976582 isoform X2 [Leptidea sinapis]
MAAVAVRSCKPVRPSHEKTSTPKSCWRDQMMLLCEAAHKVFGMLCSSAVDMYKISAKNSVQGPSNSPLANALTAPNVNSKSDRLRALRIRLKNIFIYIQAMLIETYTVAKPIQPQLILDVIVRVVSIAKDAQNSTGDLSAIKSEALRTLDALAACLGPNLIPYSPLIFRCVMQTLRWSSENPHETKKVRCDAYNSLRQWLTVLHVHKISNDNKSSLEDELTQHIIRDITPVTKVVELTMGAQPTKHMSKKAKRKLATTQLQESNIASHMPGGKQKAITCDEDDNAVTIAALECAESFLLVCGIFLKPETHKIFQERLVRDCYSLDSFSSKHALKLLRALDACRKCASPVLPPPTQYCLHLYSVMANSTNIEVSSFCSRALLDIRMHLHCSPPSLNFAIQPIKTKSIEKRKKVSERNRAVLESLIGKDKMPHTSDEIIDISDEPSRKKQRVNVDDDKISLSSDSLSSVEISDSDSEKVEEVHGATDEDVSVQVTSELIDKQNSTENLLRSEVNINNIETQDNQSEIVQVEKELLNNKENKAEVSTNEEEAVHMETEYPNGEIEMVHKKNPITTAEKTVPKFGCELEIVKDTSIHDAVTQIHNISHDSVDAEEIPRSLEVGYDYPNIGNEKVALFEKNDDENLPSSNETDDVQITCGQVLKSSQDEDIQKKTFEISTTPKENGVDVFENGVVDLNDEKDSAPAVCPKKDVLTVEDMMADFVDEVIE